MKKIIFSILIFIFYGCAGLSIDPTKRAAIDGFVIKFYMCIKDKDYNCAISAIGIDSLTTNEINIYKKKLEELSNMINQLDKTNPRLRSIIARTVDQKGNFYKVKVYFELSDLSRHHIADLVVKSENNKLSIIKAF